VLASALQSLNKDGTVNFVAARALPDVTKDVAKEIVDQRNPEAVVTKGFPKGFFNHIIDGLFATCYH
jgi:hypothetical protein